MQDKKFLRLKNSEQVEVKINHYFLRETKLIYLTAKKHWNEHPFVTCDEIRSKTADQYLDFYFRDYKYWLIEGSSYQSFQVKIIEFYSGQGIRKIYQIHPNESLKLKSFIGDKIIKNINWKKEGF